MTDHDVIRRRQTVDILTTIRYVVTECLELPKVQRRMLHYLLVKTCGINQFE